MLTRALASLPATRASAPGLLRKRTTKTGASLTRYLARRKARLALPGSLTIRRILPRPLVALAARLTMVTRASARLRGSGAALGMVAPPPRRFGSIRILLEARCGGDLAAGTLAAPRGGRGLETHLSLNPC